MPAKTAKTKLYRLAFDFKSPEAMLEFFEELQLNGFPKDAKIRMQDSLDTVKKSVRHFIVSREPGFIVERKHVPGKDVIVLNGQPLDNAVEADENEG